MSIQLKAALLVISIVVVITAANLGSSILFTQKSLMEIMENEMVLAMNIADDLISTRINLLKADARAVAEALNSLPEADIERAMAIKLAEYRDFEAFTVYDRERITSSFGYPVTDDDWQDGNKYLSKAFAGESVISTTHRDKDADELVMYVCVPMDDDRVLTGTISGMYFASVISKFRLWETGNIFILDEEGTMIAHISENMVQGRYNFIEIGRQDRNEETIARFFQRMITSDSGSGRYLFNGTERFSTFKHISGSYAGWRVGVAAPLTESPANDVRDGLWFAALMFLAAGIIIAIISSKFIAIPFHKIEEQKDNLEELNKKVIAASEAKTNFLANMSHEMRTPLNAIIGLSELTMGFDNLPEEALENIEKVCNSGMTLLGTVNDILDISKIEADKFELIPVEYELSSTINDTITQNILRIGEKPIKFVLDIEEDLPGKLFGDELRIKQILNNLLSNAFKYTKEGTVTLKIRCEQDSGGGMWLSASVTDSGIGIRREDMGKLFSTYSQVDTKANRKIEGTGLGLAITRRMVEMMNGSIDIDSEYGKGTTFHIRVRQGFVNSVPIGKDVADSLKNFQYSNQRQVQNARFVRIRLPYARVLVVDDVSTNLDVARGMMKPYAMQIDCVSSGPDAIERIRQGEQYNAIFMDHMMPGMDGVEATRIIREEIGTEYAKTVPVIALTANALQGNKEMFLQKGFQAFLSKPIDIKEMDAVIRQWVRDKDKEKDTEAFFSGEDRRTTTNRRLGGDRRQQLRRSGDVPPEAPPAVPSLFAGVQIEGLDIKSALQRFGGDEQSLLTVLRSYSAETGHILEQIAAVSADTLAGYAVLVHGIKGSSRGICAEAVGALAEELEHAAKSGDIAFVNEHNAALIEAASKLTAGIAAAIAAGSGPKERKTSPDGTLLDELKAACEDFDMDRIDAAMAELEKYEYESLQDLIVWLREMVDKMDFDSMAKRLAGQYGSAG
ncbi:MAG: response regulator [Treponema sp.]|jgi:signal transduction histidine kinase/FixJ family two-component response regulator/HPt (histidine-containing phosphotransfer) domain-containing protein|nr:response regulator [Treponema sp.]